MPVTKGHAVNFSDEHYLCCDLGLHITSCKDTCMVVAHPSGDQHMGKSYANIYLTLHKNVMISPSESFAFLYFLKWIQDIFKLCVLSTANFQV